MSDSAEKVVCDFYEALEAFELDSVMDFFSENASLNFPGNPPSISFFMGKDKIHRFFKKMISFVPDLSFDVVRRFSSSSLVCVEWNLTGNTRKGGLLIRNGVSVFDIEKDLISSMNSYIASGLFI